MEIPTKPVSSAVADHATMFVALALSQASWLVALHGAIADKVREHAIDGGESAALLALLEKTRGAAQARFGRLVRVVGRYMAGYDGFWLHRLLVAAGIDNRVLDAASILVNRQGRLL